MCLSVFWLNIVIQRWKPAASVSRVACVERLLEVTVGELYQVRLVA